MRDSISHFPARALTPEENVLFATWLSAAGDIPLAYVSNRGNDDPAHYRRIVIVSKPDAGPSHLVHAPAGRDIWVVFALGRRTRIRRFPTLTEALNSVRPVLTRPIPADGAEQCQAFTLSSDAGKPAA
jgi:hypothetical protein